MALPDDIVTEVFSYLPAKSAGRFRALSRSWRATLSSAPFVELHRRRANETGHPKLFFSTTAETSEDEESYFYSWQPGGAIKKLMPNKFYRPTPLTRPLHGLVLIRCAETGYHICNPSTGAVLAIPDSKLPLKMIPRGSPQVPYYPWVAYGFGYCSLTGKYKVVRIFSSIGHNADKYSPILCEVFVLDRLAYWRPTTQQPPICVLTDNPGVFLLNGCLHFLRVDGGIIAFDVSGETFGSVLPPPNLDGEASISMTELDGCLCVCRGHTDRGDGMYRIWMLRNYKQDKWEQLCCVDMTAWTEPERAHLEACLIAPLDMYNSDSGQKKVMIGTTDCKVLALDIPNCATQEILFCPDEETASNFEDYDDLVLGSFEESLVPVGRTIEEMVSLSPMTRAWFDILKWMPTQSVKELSLVCREWRAMVKDDCFIRSHVVHANLRKSPRVMIITDFFIAIFMDLKDFNERGRIVVDIPELVCSQPCQGLNVASCHRRSFVCNPAMGYFQRMEFQNVHDKDFYAGRVGLGYDSVNNEHVVVLITYTEKNFVTREYALECRVRYAKEQEYCSLDDPPCRPVANIQPTYVDGKIFWMVDPNLGPISLDYEVVAFDVQKKKFEVLRGPPCEVSGGSNPMSILQLQGALCVTCSDKRINVIDIWMMKDVGTWVKEYHIELKGFSPEYSSEWTTPLAVDPNDGRILLKTGWSLGYYDPKTAKMETICRVGRPGDRLKFCPIICHESFVTTLGTF
jgi:F-box interacting protein